MGYFTDFNSMYNYNYDTIANSSNLGGQPILKSFQSGIGKRNNGVGAGLGPQFAPAKSSAEPDERTFGQQFWGTEQDTLFGRKLGSGIPEPLDHNNLIASNTRFNMGNNSFNNNSPISKPNRIGNIPSDPIEVASE